MAGGETVQFNNSIYLAEKGSVDRDFALTYFLRENQCFPPGADIKKILELYFQVHIHKFGFDLYKIYKTFCLPLFKII